VRQGLMGLVLVCALALGPTDQWNEQILAYYESHPEVRTMSEREARTQYLEVVGTLTIYGSTIYRVQQNVGTKDQSEISLAVTKQGIQLYQLDSSTPFHTYELRDLLRWGYVPNTTFYVSVSRPGHRPRSLYTGGHSD
jgi:hypothetical protein